MFPPRPFPSPIREIESLSRIIILFQDEEDDDDKDGDDQDGSCWGEDGSPGNDTRDKANEFILMAKQQKDMAIAG